MKRSPAFAVLLGALSLLLCGLVYVTGQQQLRQSANDPQIQYAEDAAARLAAGSPVDTQAFGMVEVDSSLSPFMIIYTTAGKVISSSATLHSKTPELPQGVLDYAYAHHEHRLTWQPEKGVRLAVVAVAYGGTEPGVVVVGRNLGEVEKRETQLVYECGAVLLGCWVLIGAFMSLPKRLA